MANIPQTYSVTDPVVAGGSSQNAFIPEGNYKAIIIDSEMKDTNNGQGQYLALSIAIVDGEHRDTTFIERLNLINQNSKAVEIAYKTLARISEALGMQTTPSDSAQLHNQPLLIEIKTEAGKEWTNNQGEKVAGKDKSIIKGYKPLPKAGIQAPMASTAPTNAPAAAAPKAPWAA